MRPGLYFLLFPQARSLEIKQIIISKDETVSEFLLAVA